MTLVGVQTELGVVVAERYLLWDLGAELVLVRPPGVLQLGVVTHEIHALVVLSPPLTPHVLHLFIAKNGILVVVQICRSVPIHVRAKVYHSMGEVPPSLGVEDLPNEDLLPRVPLGTDCSLLPKSLLLRGTKVGWNIHLGCSASASLPLCLYI